MMPSRETSKQTWEKIDNLLHKIMRRAVAIKEDEIYADADMCTALMRNLAVETYMEDEKTDRGSN